MNKNITNMFYKITLNSSEIIVKTKIPVTIGKGTDSDKPRS